MVQRLFFDGIDGKAGGCSIAKGIEFAADVFSDIAEAGLAFAHSTEARAQRAKDASVVFFLPPQRFFHGKTIPLLYLRRKGRRFLSAPPIYRGYAIVQPWAGSLD